MKARTVGIVAAAGLAAIIGCKSERGLIPGTPTPKEDHTGEKTAIISLRCIEATEKIDKFGISQDYIRWCQDSSAESAVNSGKSDLYYHNPKGEIIHIYAKGSISNPNIYWICVPFDGCFLPRDRDFQSYLGGATRAWQEQCERFNCKELEEKWKNGEFNYDPFEF
ncbi:MAG: hypothetical protein PHO02_01705 [Candidatus Nanoarchaeia archaeon]|nr:hypothetical protein [Candidatus Nanoarchaeia archaeon]